MPSKSINFGGAAYESGVDKGMYQQENVEEKKDRLFKWNNYQKVKFSLEFVKEKLLKNLNFIRFLSLFENFNKVLFVWGSNRTCNLGLYLQENFHQYYYHQDSSMQPQEGEADKVFREFTFLNQKRIKKNDDLLIFQSLLTKWQDEIIKAKFSNINLNRLK